MTDIPRLMPRAIALLAAAFVLLPSDRAAAQTPAVRLSDVTDRTGIDFLHTHGESGNGYIVEYICSGLALFDYDGDGWVDIYFLNGAALRGSSFAAAPRNKLYRNEGGFRFTDVTDRAGLGETGHSLGVAAADFDNDGDQDLYISNYGPNVFLENNGDGTFRRAGAAALLQDGDRVGAGVCFLDIEGDGDLDLYSASYVQFSYDKHVPRTFLGAPTAPSPKDYSPQSDSLFRNGGDGSFVDISAESGIGKHAGPGMGTVCADLDDDGDSDIIVSNDSRANFLFENDGRGRFTEVGVIMGLAYDFAGLQQGSMGVDCADYDNDGLLDLVMTSYQDQLPALYRNSGQGFFEDVAVTAGLRSVARSVNWGVSFVDFDCDGRRDIFMANGHLDETIKAQDDSLTYAERNSLFLNNGRGRFVDVSDDSGDGMLVKRVSRGAAFDDLDNDGDIDVVVLNTCAAPTVLRNDTPPGAHWTQVRLVGRAANRDGVGARIKVVTQRGAQIAEVHSGRGYQSDYGRRVHFGLGDAQSILRIEVRWPGGQTETYANPPVDQIITLHQQQAYR